MALFNDSKEQKEIDFVVLWVDGNDPKWLREFNKYALHTEGDKRKCRFRDWDNLKYLFRAFDYCAPWVRKIHFVTWGHLPSWLNRDHCKLNVVLHDEILPKESLPVFNCNPLEVSLHKIEGLADQFVYFNDDMFLLSPVSGDYFFKNGFPKDMCVFNAIFLDTISHIRLNNIEVLAKWFSKRSILSNSFFKVFNLRYGLHQLRTLLLLPWPQFTGFYDPHQPQPFLKNTFNEVWSLNKDILTKTSQARFRTKDDVNQYLFRYWQLLEGNFCPRSFSDTKTIPVRLDKDVDLVVKAILSNKYRMLCINDELADIESNVFKKYKEAVIQAFDTVFPRKSSFEL